MSVKRLLLSVTSFTLMGIVQAQPVPGGLPDVAGRVTVLETTATTLQNRVSTLETQVATLQSQVNTLQSQVTTLQNSNSSLQNALDAEISGRKSTDTSLQAALVQEVFDRFNADNALRAAISTSSRGFLSFNPEAQLVNGATATIGTIGPLPAGSYEIVATASVFNPKNNADWDCRLVRDDNNGVIGRTSEGTTSPSTFSTESAGTSWGNVTIPALVTLADNGKVHMTCSTGVAGSTVFEIQMVATSVGSAAVQCPDVLFPCNE